MEAAHEMLRVIRNVLTKRPILAIFDVTRRCNQRCAFCNIWRSSSDEMALEQIREHAKRLQRFGVGYVFIQGGEPTLRPDLVEIVDAFIGRGIKPTVITNGIRLTEDLARQLGERRCNLAISLDTLDRDEFARIRGVDRLETVLANIESVSKLPHKGNWAVTTTVTSLTTLEGVQALERFARDRGLMYAIRPYVYVNGTAGKKDDEMAYQERDHARVAGIFEWMLGKAYRENYLAALVYEEHLRYVKGEAMPLCDAMRYSFLVRESGAIAPCIEFPDVPVDLDRFGDEKRTHAAMLAECNRCTPCFYNDAREIGVLLRKKWRAAAHLPLVMKQMREFGNFF